MRKTVYALEVYQLQKPYRAPESLQNATRLHSFESSTGIGEFHVGETYTESQPTRYLGTIQHIHHWFGEGEGTDLVHRTMLYVYNPG